MQNILYKLYDKTDFTRHVRNIIIELPGKPEENLKIQFAVRSDFLPPC